MASVNRIRGNGNRIKKDLSKEKIVKDRETSNVNTFKPKKYVGYRDRLFLRIVLLFVFISLFILSLYYGINTKNSNIYSYTEDGNIDYRVYLNDNNYYSTPFLNSNMRYISSLIDYLDVDFNYKLDFNNKYYYSYNYYIVGDLYIYEGTNKDKILYKKRYNILNPVYTANQYGDNISLNLNRKIDYSLFDSVVKEFNSNFSLITNSEIVFSLHVNVDSRSDFLDSVRVEGSNSISVPLDSKTISLSVDNSNIKDSKTFSDDSCNYFNLFMYFISFISFIFIIVSIISIIKYMYKTRNVKSNYQASLDKILREYDRAIINAKSDYIIKNVDNFIDVSSFMELMDVHDNLDLPILYIEIAKGHKSWFIINSREGVYRFVLKNID